MSFARLISLFEESEFMDYIAYFFLFNLAIALFEIIIDLVTSKKRRWKDTGANAIIFVLNQLLSNTLVGTLGIIALMEIHFYLFSNPIRICS